MKRTTLLPEAICGVLKLVGLNSIVIIFSSFSAHVVCSIVWNLYLKPFPKPSKLEVANDKRALQ